MALTPITMTGSTDTILEGFTKVNDIIDDLAAVTTGLGASCIGVFDTAGNMAATNVEAALAEVYTDVSSARTLSDIFDKNAATTTGLTFGYKGGSIRVDNTVTAIAAGTISVTDDSVNYIEISQAGVVSRNGTGFTSGSIPIRQVTAASGVQTVSTDKRAWFVQINLAVPGAIGGTTPAAGAFTTLTASTPIAVASGGSGTTGDSIVKGWIHFNGTGVIAIQDSFNVTSITDNGTGNYTITWATDFTNDDYACVVSSTSPEASLSSTPAVGSIAAYTLNSAGAAEDATILCAIATGDQ